MITNHTDNKQTNIQVQVLTPEELELQKLEKMFDDGHRKLKYMKQKIAQLQRKLKK